MGHQVSRELCARRGRYSRRSAAVRHVRYESAAKLHWSDPNVACGAAERLDHGLAPPDRDELHDCRQLALQPQRTSRAPLESCTAASSAAINSGMVTTASANCARSSQAPRQGADRKRGHQPALPLKLTSDALAVAGLRPVLACGRRGDRMPGVPSLARTRQLLRRCSR
jgi:hypothetical protein